MDSTDAEKEKDRITEALKTYNKVINLTKTTLLLIGVWPLAPGASKTRLIMKKIQVAVIIISHFFLIIPQWCDMYELRGNLKATVETLDSNIFVCPGAFKYIYFLTVAREFEKLLETMRSNWVAIMKLPDTEENLINKNILLDWTAKASSRCRKYGTLLFCAGTLYRIQPLINGLGDPGPRDRVYPFMGRYYIDRNSDIAYFFCHAGQYWSGIVVEVTHYACDTSFFVITFHLCAQLAILQNNLMKLGQGKENDLERQKVLIDKHQREISNADELETVFGVASFQQIMASCLIIGINGFKLVISINEREPDAANYFLTLIFLILQIFIYCFPGEQLINQSECVDTAIAQSNWYNFSTPALSNSQFMSIRAQKPLMVTAGKVFVLSMESFMKIVKTSMSSLSVLRAMYDK